MRKDGSVLDSSPAKIRASVESSLKRLNTDYIDLYYQHRIDPKVEPQVVAETMGQLIPESRKENRIQENFGSVHVVLSTEEIAKIDSLLDTMDLPAYGKK